MQIATAIVTSGNIDPMILKVISLLLQRQAQKDH